MRIVLTIAVTLAGCGSGSTIPHDTTDASTGGHDLAVSHDAATVHDLSSPSGNDAGAGAPCTTACDCDAGLACINMVCTSGIEPVYCCGSNDCPQGKQCQDDKGNAGLCGGGGGFDGGFSLPDGGFSLPDGGFSFDFGGGFGFDFGGGFGDGGGFCGFIPCQNDQLCQMLKCGACTNGKCSN